MTPSNGDRDRVESDDIARLIAAAGRRPTPDAAVRESVRAAVERAWLEETARRRGRRAYRWAAAAAVVASAVGLAWFGLRGGVSEAPTTVGTLVAARGTVHLTSPSDRGPIVAGSRLDAGTVVRTGANGYLLLTSAAIDLRVGPGTVLDLDHPGHVQLTHGRIYVDSGPEGVAHEPLVVDTPFGRVNHLGTQFQVVVHSSSMWVGVRSGRVSVNGRSGRRETLARGQGVAVYPGGAVQRMAITPYGREWAWVNTLTPDFPIDGRPLSEFLAWYTRETGRRLELQGPATQAAIDQTRLSGSIAGLTPTEALAAVMATTRLQYDMNSPGELRIGIRGASAKGN